jgi:hypothetical protein
VGQASDDHDLNCAFSSTSATICTRHDHQQPDRTPAARSMRPQRTAAGTHRSGQDRLSPTGTRHFAIWRIDDGPRALCRGRAPARRGRPAYQRRYLRPEWTLTLTAAHVHATLALAAATAVETVGPDRHAWADIAATKYGSKPEPPSGSPPDPGPEQRRPPPLFPPEDRPRH